MTTLTFPATSTSPFIEEEIQEKKEMHHHISLDWEGYKEKPNEKENAQIRERLNHQKASANVSIDELAIAIENGQTFNLSSGHSISIFVLDYDDTDLYMNERFKCTPKKYLSLLDIWEIKCCMIYNTFSGNESWNKFRVVFQVDNLIFNPELAKMILKSLNKVLRIESFKPTGYLQDYFYGSYKGSVVYKEPNNYLDISKILHLL